MKGMIREYKQRYAGNYRDRTMLFSAFSFAINALLGVGKLTVGLITGTAWLIVTAIYYLILCLCRGHVLYRFAQTFNIKDFQKRFDMQFSVYRHEGAFLCLLGISYAMVCARMYSGDGNMYPRYLIYGVAGVAFYKIASAIHGVIVTNRMKNPLLSTLKTIKFIDACVSIVSVQCAILSMKGAASANTSSAILGIVLSFLFVGIGIYMMHKKKVYPNEDEYEILDIVKSEKRRQYES